MTTIIKGMYGVAAEADHQELYFKLEQDDPNEVSLVLAYEDGDIEWYVLLLTRENERAPWFLERTGGLEDDIGLAVEGQGRIIERGNEDETPEEDE